MARVLSVAAERFPIAGTFTISRGSKTEAEVISCTIREGGHSGRGECVPYRRYGETMEASPRQSRPCAARSSAGCDRTGCSGACRRAQPATRWTAPCGIWKPSESGHTRRLPASAQRRADAQS